MLSWIYKTIIEKRNSFYEKGVFKSHSLGVPVISIGNITVGGTGKTPLVAFVAETLAESGEKVCILSRGYGRANPKKLILVSDGEQVLADAAESGDEPFELACKLVGKAIVIADANRFSAGNWARQNFNVTVFVLDDAFQHRKVKRDLNIITIDATNPFGNGKTLPFGILREPLRNLKRADIICITRANLSGDISNLKTLIKKYNNHCPIFTVENRILSLTNIEWYSNNSKKPFKEEKSKDEHLKKKSIAFCALGNPNSFFDQLRQEQFHLAAAEKFPDHHIYSQSDIFKIENTAREHNAKILLTTVKDAVKLKNLHFGLPCFAVENRLIFNDENGFRDVLRKTVERKNEV